MATYNDFFEMLKQDHQEVKDIMEEISESSDRATRTRENLFMKLKQGLVPHMKAEEQVLYPKLKAEEESKKDAMEAMEEHHVAELVFNELDKMAKDEEFWGAKASVLKDLLDHHVEEEESQVFQDIKEVIPQEEVDQLITDFKDAKSTVMRKVGSSSRS